MIPSLSLKYENIVFVFPIKRFLMDISIETTCIETRVTARLFTYILQFTLYQDKKETVLYSHLPKISRIKIMRCINRHQSRCYLTIKNFDALRYLSNLIKRVNQDARLLFI